MHQDQFGFILVDMSEPVGLRGVHGLLSVVTIILGEQLAVGCRPCPKGKINDVYGHS